MSDAQSGLLSRCRGVSGGHNSVCADKADRSFRTMLKDALADQLQGVFGDARGWVLSLVGGFKCSDWRCMTTADRNRKQCGDCCVVPFIGTCMRNLG